MKRVMAGLVTLILTAGNLQGRTAREVVAVLPFEITGMDQRLSVIITNTIRNTFTKEKYSVLRGDRMLELLAKNGVTKAACARADCGILLGRLLKVDAVVVGEVLLRGEEVYIHSGLIEVRRGIEIRSAQQVFSASNRIHPFSHRAE